MLGHDVAEAHRGESHELEVENAAEVVEIPEVGDVVEHGADSGQEEEDTTKHHAAWHPDNQLR